MEAQEPGSVSNKQTKPKGKKFDNPASFKKDAYEPVIKVSTVNAAGEEGTFTFDPQGVLNIAEAIVNSAMGVVDQRFNGMYNRAVVEESIKRLTLLTTCKKIVNAAGEDERARMYSLFSPVRYQQIVIPEPLKEVVEGIGAFDFNGANYKLRSVQLAATSLLARAVGVPGSDGIPGLALLPGNAFGWDLTFANIDVQGWKNDVFTEYRDRYNAWADSATNVWLNNGGMTYRPPIVQAGFAALAVLLGAAGGVPASVTRDVAVASTFEQNLGNNNFPTPGQANALVAQRLIIVNWDKTLIQQKLRWWHENHEQPMNNVMGHLFPMHKVDSFTAEGARWQLMNVEGNVGSAPFALPAKDTEMGMIVTNKTIVEVNKKALVTTASQTGSVRAEIFVGTKFKPGI
jgi:hypothetical protein